MFGQDVVVDSLSPIESAGVGGLAFVSHARYAKAIDTTNASALIVPPALADRALARVSGVIVTPDVYHYFALLTQHWKRISVPSAAAAGVHATAVIAGTARLGVGVSVGPLAVIGEYADIANGVQIGAHTVLGHHVTVGADSLLHPRVTVADGCVVGARNIIHSGAVIGADGFGFAQHEGRWIKIEQLGAVRLGDDVEIGANTCIDRGALEDTLIGNGVKLDNLVQIGHNVKVGDHTAMAGCVGVAGSAVIGAHCTVGGGAVVLGHLSLADGVHVSAASVVMRSLNRPGQYTGVFPIDDNADWEKNAATLKQLHALRERIKRLEKP